MGEIDEFGTARVDEVELAEEENLDILLTRLASELVMLILAGQDELPRG